MTWVAMPHATVIAREQSRQTRSNLHPAVIEGIGLFDLPCSMSPAIVAL
jgi:hypothetical protein